MSPIKKILKYFFHHSFSGEMVDRVHQRLAEPGDEREKEEVLREIWNEIGFPEVPVCVSRHGCVSPLSG